MGLLYQAVLLLCNSIVVNEIHSYSLKSEIRCQAPTDETYEPMNSEPWAESQLLDLNYNGD